MKILLTADLHRREEWFRLLSRATGYDLICIAGDLLDMFNAESKTVQARTVSRWIRDLAKVGRVAVSSGNHDDAGSQLIVDRAPIYQWLHDLRRDPRIITDGSTEVLGDLVITTVPYFCSREQKSIWLDRGAIIRRHRGSPWLVLHHVPPIAFPGSTKEEVEAAEILQTYRPDYFVSGHSHQFPYFPGNSWAQVVNGVHVLVPGQLLRAPFPNHIVLNTESGEVSWETSSREWIAKDGLYDHLVLKFPHG
jgi:Icc-related predicted phosphoesterase